MENKSFIWKNLKYLRNKKQISQETLSYEIDISRSAVGSYEENRSTPPVLILIKLSDFFGCSIDDFIRVDIKKKSKI